MEWGRFTMRRRGHFTIEDARLIRFASRDEAADQIGGDADGNVEESPVDESRRHGQLRERENKGRAGDV